MDLAGGADALADRARAYLDRKMPLEALRLLDVARGSETRKVLRARIDALEMLLSSAKAGLNNYSEVAPKLYIYSTKLLDDCPKAYT